jgi:hypothetical protein
MPIILMGAYGTRYSLQFTVQWYAPIKIIGIKIIGIRIIVPIKSKKSSLRLMAHISKTLTKSLR